jgi:TP901 family phage tail tape measure protein
MATVMAELEAVVTADTSGFDSAMTSSGQKVDELGTKGQAASANFGAASAAMAAGAVGIGAGIADAIGMAGNFEAAMNEIGSVTGATATEMEALSAMALQVGQDTAFSAQEGAAAISELGKAGIPIPDILEGAAMATADLAAAGGVDMPRAAEVMSNAMNVFGIEGAKAADVADTLAGAANTSATDINSLAMGMAQVGPSAAGLGLSLEETVAQLALFADAGMQGSDAGTSMKTMLTSLTPSTKAAREKFQELGLSTDEVSNAFFDAQGNFVGMEKASETLYTALADLTDQQRAEALETIFGSDASRAAELTFQAQKAAVEGTGRGYDSYLEAVQASGQATTVANAKMKGMNGALEALSGSIDTAKIAFGMAFLPAVEAVAEGLASLVNLFIGLPPEIQTVISFVAAGAAAFLAVGAAVGFIIGPMGSFIALMKPVALAVAGISTPLLLVAAAIAALYVAYQTNFLGFADGVNAAAGAVMATFNNLVATVQAFVVNFQAAIADGLNPVEAAFSALAVTAHNLGLEGVAQAFYNLQIAAAQAGAIVETLVAAFQNWRALGLDPVHAALAALSTVFPQLSGAVQVAIALWENFKTTLAGVAQGLQDALAALAAGDIAGVLQGLFDAAMAAVQGFITSLSIIGQGVLDAFAAIDWGAISVAIQTALQDISIGLMQWAGEASAALIAAIQDIWNEITVAIGPAWQGILAAISDAWTLIKFAVTTALETIKTTISDAWIAIETSVTTTLETLNATVLAAWTKVQETVALAMQTVTETVSNTWTGIETTLSATLETIKTTVSTAWEAVKTTITTVLQDIQSATGVQFETIGTVISGAMEAVQTTISSAWTTIQTTVTTTLQDITSAISAQFEAIKTTITTAATEAKDGFIATLQEMATEALIAVMGVKDAIVGVFAGARDWLFQAGADIIGGVVDGILSMGSAVSDAIASVVPDSVGLPTLDFAAPVGEALTGGGGGGGGSTSSGGRTGTRRAAGGPVRAGLSYWVGERGPEPFIPSRSGRILSHDDAMTALGGGGRGNPYNVTEIKQVVVRDERDLDRWVRSNQRSQRVASRRGN